MVYLYTMKNKGIRLAKQEKAHSYLRARLLLLQDGAPLPGIRKMCAESGLGRMVLEQQLTLAEEEGLLIRKDRSGYYRTTLADERKKSEFALRIMCSDCALEPVGDVGSPSYISRIIIELFDIARKNGTRLKICRSNEEIPESVSGVFLLSPADLEESSFLEERFPRTVAVSGCGGRVAVFPPYGKLTRAALEHLSSLGHRKIGIVHHNLDVVNHFNPHLFEYYRFMAESGLQVHPGFVVSYPDGERCRRELGALFSSPLRPTALITPGCWYALVCRVLRELKLNIPYQVSVLVIGKVPEKSEDSPFPTRFEDSPESLARMAWEVMSHYPAGALQLTPELQLLPGKSVMALEH